MADDGPTRSSHARLRAGRCTHPRPCRTHPIPRRAGWRSIERSIGTPLPPSASACFADRKQSLLLCDGPGCEPRGPTALIRDRAPAITAARSVRTQPKVPGVAPGPSRLTFRGCRRTATTSKRARSRLGTATVTSARRTKACRRGRNRTRLSAHIPDPLSHGLAAPPEPMSERSVRLRPSQPASERSRRPTEGHCLRTDPALPTMGPTLDQRFARRPAAARMATWNIPLLSAWHLSTSTTGGRQ